MSTVITVENLGKKYIISHRQQEQSYSLRDALTRSLASVGKHVCASFRANVSAPETIDPEYEEFWALKDVSFEVKQGDRVGIIGRNGAGKSTLLKILSRITEPTTGSIRIRGRVASLLEVGTGFHPELSGRENIFLNGAILGMSRQEIKSKFDEIVDFAEIDRFLDTPVKRYSSGMYVRLAFAVAAHLEPEILIVDEVLAVGDAAFQKKCLGKMEDVSANDGRTVLFVSHNMNAITTLCTRAVMLESGEIAASGTAYDVINFYNEKSAVALDVDNANRGGPGGIRIQNVWLEDSSGREISVVASKQAAYLKLEAEVDPLYQNGKKIGVGFGIDNTEGSRLFTVVSSWLDTEITTCGDKLVVRCYFSSFPFVPGRYLVSASILHQTETLDCVINCSGFEIKEGDASHSQWSSKHGFLNIPCSFEALDV